MLDGFAPHDLAALKRLPAEQYEAQRDARLALYDYCTDVWDRAKAEGQDPANDPRFAAVAALRDLTGGLAATAEELGTRP